MANNNNNNNNGNLHNPPFPALLQISDALLTTAANNGCNRLQLVGEGFLHDVISRFLYRQYPHLDADGLYFIKSNLLSTAQLSTLCQRFRLLLQESSSSSSSNIDELRLSGLFKAYIGAVCLDKGDRVLRPWFQLVLGSLAGGYFDDWMAGCQVNGGRNGVDGGSGGVSEEIMDHDGNNDYESMIVEQEEEEEEEEDEEEDIPIMQLLSEEDIGSFEVRTTSYY